MTRSEIRLGWGAGVPAALWDPKHGLRSWPHDLDPAEGRPADMDVSDERWNNGCPPVYQSWSGLTGTVLAPRRHPLTLQLCTLRADTVRWEARHANCMGCSDASTEEDWHSTERQIYAVHRHLELTGDLLVAWPPPDHKMILTPAGRLADVLLGSIEPAEWLQVSQTAYVAGYWTEHAAEAQCGLIDGTHEWWGHREFLRALRAVNAAWLQVGRIGYSRDRIRDFPGLDIIGIFEDPDTDPNNGGRMTVYRRSAGMLVERLAEDLAGDWQPQAWAEQWPDVLFSEDGRWIAPGGPDGKLVFGPCGCSSRGEWSDTDPYTDLLIDPHRVPEHPTCVSDNWHGHSRRPVRNRTTEAPAEAPAEPLEEWEEELLRASGHADLI